MDFYEEKQLQKIIEQQHLRRIVEQQGKINYLFKEFIRSASPLMTKWAKTKSDSVWVGNSAIENKIDNLLSDLHSNLQSNISKGMEDGWNRGNKKADELVKIYIKDMSVSDLLQNKMFARNKEALSAMLNRKDEYGYTISSRVWKITENTKDNLDFYLQSGLSSGRSAARISQDMIRLLNNSDMTFTYVKNDKGKLVFSKPMQDYHPGQGVYRSPYKNALRLSATKINESFRIADHDRWQNMDFVTGIEVKRSPSHTAPCKICDPRAGKYDKDFSFTGWHPFCICIAVPIMLDKEDFANYLIDG